MARAASRPGRAALILALVLAAILTYMDLTSPRSLFRGLWNAAFPAETRGKTMKDNVINQVNPRR